MFLLNHTLVLWIYLLSVNLFYILLRYFALADYFACFACKEMDALDKSYDYIIVGSGSAGSIIAHRLSEDKNLKILLLEAGSDGNSLLDAPAMGLLLQNSVYDWQYRTVPQRNACLGLEDSISNWPMGKIVGGTNMINNMVYVRGHPEDYSSWFRGIKPHFNYALEILPYFEKLERLLSINDLKFSTPLGQHILEAAKNLGFPTNQDLDCKPGFSFPKSTTLNGKRFGPIHILKNASRKNLILRTNTIVERVLFKNGNEAYGVKYSYLGEKFRAKASKGVILSAGVIGTPKILMLSGIGPSEHLNSVNIEPLVNLPVGENLQDHVTTGLDLVLLNNSLGLEIEDLLSPYSVFDYFFKSKGPWTTIGCENLGFINKRSLKNQVPDVQFMVLPLAVSTDGGMHLRKLAGIKRSNWDKYFARNLDKFAITLAPIVTHPKSRGTVKLRDNNPNSNPIIDPNYLSDPYDVEILLKGIDIIKKLLRTESMKKLGAELNTNHFPGCENYKFNSKPYWECYVRHLTITSYHPVGTCPFGKVVDLDFKLKGTRKLFVVDGSVLPTLTTGNPNAAIMMLAEKASDSIRSRDFGDNNAKCEINKRFF